MTTPPTTEQWQHAVDKAAGAVRNILGSRGDLVEDVLQEACLSATRHLDGFRGEANFTTWFYRIAVNQALMIRRKRYLRAEIHFTNLEREQDGEIVPFDAPDVRVQVLEEIIQAQQIERVLAESRKLSPELLCDNPTGSNVTRKARKFRAIHELRRRLAKRQA